MNFNKISKAYQACQGRGLILMLAIILFAPDIFAQDYTVTLRQRRMGDQIGVEFWLKNANENLDNISFMTIGVNYNTEHLAPADASLNPLGVTDSVDYNVEQSLNDLPYRTITSPYDNDNDYSALTAGPVTDGTTYAYLLNVTMPTIDPSNGVAAGTEGLGTFVGILRFDIINHATLDDSDLTGIVFNTETTIGDFVVFDVNGDDIEPSFTVVNDGDMAIRGISILNPNGPDEAVNRNKNYSSIETAGYPIYFERSGLIEPSSTKRYGLENSKLAYAFDYVVGYDESLADPNQNWVEFMRVAEHRDSPATLVGAPKDTTNYRWGEIVTSTGTDAGYWITQGDGEQLPPGAGDGYDGVLRVIWDDNPFFAERSEEARLRIRMLDTLTTTTTAIATRNDIYDDIYGMSEDNFILSRLFFLQLNGTSEYLKTQDNFDNPTQITVMSWVNLSSVSSATTTKEPAIIASSNGPGFDEGAWMLYLKDGLYPAFRAKDIKAGDEPGRGEVIDGVETEYIGLVESPNPLTVENAPVPIDDNDAHPGNWYHIAAVVNQNTVSLYVDGELVDQKTNTNANDIRLDDATQPLWFGINPSNTIDDTDYLHAGLKEIQVWRKALSQNDIRDYISGVVDPSDAPATDNKTALEFYYTFNGVSNDEASSNAGNQNGANIIQYFTSLTGGSSDIPEERYPYRPDRAHLRVTSPTMLSGVSNLEDARYPVRYAAFGMGDKADPSSDLVFEFSRDGGENWAYAIDGNGDLLDDVDIEDGQALWEPYQSATVVGRYNDLQAVAPGDSNYAKTVRLRVRGTSGNNQDDISFTTDDFTVAPYFALQMAEENSQIKIESGKVMNMLGGAAMLEAWVRPYRFPTTEEAYFPIINKKDTTTNQLHYALRLLETGQLQLAIGNSTGTELLATVDDSLSLEEPNSQSNDSVWTHVAAYVNLGNGTSNPTVKMYIDGNLVNDSLVTGSLIDANDVTIDSENAYQTWIGYENRGTSASYNQSFIGELKGIRFWNGVPNNETVTGSEPTDLTKFIQGAANVKGSELLTDFQDNLIASFDLDGGSVVRNDYEYNSIYSTINGATDDISAKIIVNNGVKYTAVEPYVKLVEPQFQQQVAQDDSTLTVRWVGFFYDEANFTPGNNALSDQSDIEWSSFGGGNSASRPFNPTASDNDNAAFTDALSLPLTSESRFQGTDAPLRRFGGTLNVALTKFDSLNNEQDPMDAALLDAQLRLSAEAQVNSATSFDWTTFSRLRDESPLFTITPPSNFTVRILLEGMQRGAVEDFSVGNTGNDQSVGTGSFNSGALRITLYSDQGGVPGRIMAQAVNTQPHQDMNPLSADGIRGADGSQFGDVNFVFTDEIADSTYFVLVEHENHLPVMSRYAAPYLFDGDPKSSWQIESGWDFQSWDGDTTNVISEANGTATPPVVGSDYTALGAVSIDITHPDYSRTGLHYNIGQDGTSTTDALPAMVAGDVVRDGQINSADGVQARVEVGTSIANPSADVTQDGVVTALDRNIVDRNNFKNWSLADVLNYEDIYGTTSIVRPDDKNDGVVNTNAIAMSEEMNRVYSATNQINEFKVNEIEGLKKSANTLQSGGISYNVITETNVDEGNGIVTLSVYIENVGAEWAIGNSTFAFNYDNNLLSYRNLVDIEGSIFSKQDELGYYKSYSAPMPSTPNPLDNMRTIEIDYDNRPYFENGQVFKKEGTLVPYEKTLVGTLVFEIRNPGEASEFAFTKNKHTVILDIWGRNLTGDGNFDGDNSGETTVDAQITSPNGGETWRTGKSYFITWTKPSYDQLVNVELSIDRGSSWFELNDSQNPLDAQIGTYEYMVEDWETSEALVRLVDADNGSVIDESDDVFTITPPKNKITKPSSSDPIYISGTVAQIQWVTDDVTEVKFKLSPNGQTNWFDIAAIISSQAGGVEFTVPNGFNTTSAVIAMYDANTNEYLASSEPFRILDGDINFTSPAAGAILYFDQIPRTTVEWLNLGASQFDLELSKDGGNTWELVSADVNSLRQEFDWLLPQISVENAVLRATYNQNDQLEFDRTGIFSIDGGTDVETGTGFELNVESPYPNPFNEETTINFTLPNAMEVTAELFDASGRSVATVTNGQTLSGGNHTLTFNGESLNSGVYFIKLTLGGEVIVKEVVLQK
jgi:hypothetical protein